MCPGRRLLAHGRAMRRRRVYRGSSDRTQAASRCSSRQLSPALPVPCRRAQAASAPGWAASEDAVSALAPHASGAWPCPLLALYDREGRRGCQGCATFGGALKAAPTSKPTFLRLKGFIPVQIIQQTNAYQSRPLAEVHGPITARRRTTAASTCTARRCRTCTFRLHSHPTSGVKCNTVGSRAWLVT